MRFSGVTSALRDVDLEALAGEADQLGDRERVDDAPFEQRRVLVEPGVAPSSSSLPTNCFSSLSISSRVTPAPPPGRPPQGQPVDLSVPGARQLLEEDHAVDDHMARQPLGAVALELQQRWGLAAPARNATRRASSPDPRAHGGVLDVGVREQRRLDLAELHPMSPDLDHVVAPADVAVLPVRFLAHDVARSVRAVAVRLAPQ